MQALTRSYNALGADLYKKLGAKGNAAMSPASIGVALGMTYVGARKDTAAQMKKALHLTLDGAALDNANAAVLTEWQGPLLSPDRTPRGPEAGEVIVRVANRLFIHKALKVEDPFLKSTRDAFGAPVDLVDFAAAPQPARKHINDWVTQQTGDRIKDLLPPDGVTPDTRIVLTNALYFKAKWSTQFEKSHTKSKPFFADGTRKIDVPTMTQIGHYKYSDVGDAEIAEIDYVGARFAMAIVLPKKRDGLAAVESKLSGDALGEWFTKAAPTRISLELPKFKIEPGESLRLKPALSELGMPVAFDPEKADFTGIHVFKTPEDRLLISNVFHKAFVEVNETGTEAAAATAVSMARAGAAPPTEEPKPFVVDHPFLFLIRDTKTGLVMFIGRVTQPT
jgi:serpin B